MLFPPPPRFSGFRAEGFESFSIRDRDERRRAILEKFHPALELLRADLIDALQPRCGVPLHGHLPRLDWPKGYQPFCTWLALSYLAHGYQAGPQLNLGVHADHVSIRLAWDVASEAFGRLEFFTRHGDLGEAMVVLAREHGFRFRVYAAAPWPAGSLCVFESGADWAGAFDEVRRRGVWFELGVRLDLPEALPIVTSPRLGTEALEVFIALLPLFERLVGHAREGREA